MKKYVLLAIILIITTMASYSESLILSQKYQTIPQNEEVIYDCNSTIDISFTEEIQKIMKINSLNILLNNINITKKCSYNKNSINYMPIMPLPEGKNIVEVAGIDSNGEKFSIKWSFSIKPHDNITSIENDARDTLIENEILTVELKGQKGAKAYFDIGNKIEDVPMKEVSPGIYKGAYKVKTIDNLPNETITGHLKFNSLLESSIVCNNKVTIRGDLFLVKVTSPKPDEKVKESFEIVGRTKPFAQVSISSLVWLKNIPIVNELKADTGGYEAFADENGIFRMKYGIPFKFKDTTLTLRFLAKDEKGNYSIPHTITLTQK